MPSEAPDDHPAAPAPALDAETLALPLPAFLAPAPAPVPAETVRVSTNAEGSQANGDSYNPALSGNARSVAFESYATDLVPGDANGVGDIFVKDLRTGAVTLASADAQGNGVGARSLYPSISATGRFVAFDTLPTFGPSQRTDVYVKDLRTGRLTLASADAQGNPGDGPSYGPPSISGNGRHVAFYSDATNLVPGDANGTGDIFVKTLRTGQVALASADAAGHQANAFSQAPSLSADGRTVAFSSGATNFAPVPGNGIDEIFVKDLRTGQLTLASADAAGNAGNGESNNPSISADGRTVAFASAATNLAPGDADGLQDIFVKDLRTGQVTLVSADAAGNHGNGISAAPAISPNGRFVSFESNGSNLVPGAGGGHADVFLKDLWTGGIGLIAANPPPPPRQGITFARTSVTDTGEVAFASRTADLVPGDTNGASDIFLST